MAIRKSVEEVLKIKPVYVHLIHRYPYMGPCRFGQGEQLERSYDEMMERYLELSRTSDSLAEDYETAELLEKVKQLLTQRKKPAQEVVWMRAQGYTFAEIAKAVGISESSARTLDFRTKHWLKEQLGFL